MGDESHATNKSMSGTRRPSAPDKPDLHPGRKLAYYFKREHSFLREMVESGMIRYDTLLEIDVEQCTAPRPAMSLRSSVHDKHDPNSSYNRYSKNLEMLRDEVEEHLVHDETGAPMWDIKVNVNDPKRVLGPKEAPESKRKPRLGAFEVILSWVPPEKGRQEVVIFSKLNTQRFPHPRDLVQILLQSLAPARSCKFRVIARNVPQGSAAVGATIKCILDTTNDEWPQDGIPLKTNNFGYVEPVLPFGPFTAFAERTVGEADMHRGMAQFDVHGELNKCICVPIGETPAEGEVRVALTWAEFPHSVSLFVKTPEGKIWRPPHDDLPEGGGSAGGGAGDNEIPEGCTLLPNAELECTHIEGGYGPISVLLKSMLPGRYHIFAKCKPYKLPKGDIGWTESNAQLSFFGCDAESLEWSGPKTFVHPKEGEGDWWDICFLDVDERGCVTVRSFDVLVPDEPGNRMVTITAKDLEGKPVPGVKVLCQADSSSGGGGGESGEPGDTDDNGQLVIKLQLAQYTVKVEKPGYINAAVKLLVDLDPACPEVVVPMVKPEVFRQGPDLLCVLSWGGIDLAEMHIETPGRLLKRPEGIDDEIASFEINPQTPMQVRGTNPKYCLVSAPVGDPNLVIQELEDRIWVNFKGGRLDEGGLEMCNMQLSIFSYDKGMFFKLNPGKLEEGKSLGNFWEVATLQGGQVLPNSARSDGSPATGGIYKVRVMPSRELEAGEGEPEFNPMPDLTIRSSDEGKLMRHFVEPPAEGTPDYSCPLEYSMFLPFGRYSVEASDDRWWGPVLSENVVFTAQTQASLGLCMVGQRDCDAKTCFVTLTWAEGPADLDLCLRCPEGTVSALTKLEGKGTPVKSVKYEQSVVTGFGPKTVSLQQPLSGKFKVYVMNRDANGQKISLLKCNPVVTIVIYQGVWKQFQLKRPEGWEEAMNDPSLGPMVWHVCDLEVTNDNKMSDACLLCTEINKQMTIEPGNDGA